MKMRSQEVHGGHQPFYDIGVFGTLPTIPFILARYELCFLFTNDEKADPRPCLLVSKALFICSCPLLIHGALALFSVPLGNGKAPMRFASCPLAETTYSTLRFLRLRGRS